MPMGANIPIHTRYKAMPTPTARQVAGASFLPYLLVESGFVGYISVSLEARFQDAIDAFTYLIPSIPHLLEFSRSSSSQFSATLHQCLS